jgi:hypothetical protein
MPLKAESTITNAAVMTKTPIVEMREMRVMMFFFLPERMYFSAM